LHNEFHVFSFWNGLRKRDLTGGEGLLPGHRFLTWPLIRRLTR
jgi:hypothetical protein